LREAHADQLGVERAAVGGARSRGRNRQWRLGRRRAPWAELRDELALLAERPGQQLGQVDPASGHRGRQQQDGVGPVLAGRLLDDRRRLDADLPARRRVVKVIGRFPARAGHEVLQLQLGAQLRAARPIDDRDHVDDAVREAAPVQRLHVRDDPVALLARLPLVAVDLEQAVAGAARTQAEEVQRLPP